MGKEKVTQVDISFIIESAISIGVAAACGLVGQKRIDILRRFDRDPAFADRMAKLISADMARGMAQQRDRAGDDAAFKTLVDSIIAEAGRLVPSA